MSQKGTYYQFNLDFKGSYIRGYMVSTLEQDRYFKIDEPTYSDTILTDRFKSNNNQINLLKNAVVCYFEISKN